MRAAAAIFLVTGLAYLCQAVIVIISKGLHSWFGLLVEAAFTASLLYFAYSLFRATVGARWGAIFVSACLVVLCGIMLWQFDIPFVLAHLRSVNS